MILSVEMMTIEFLVKQCKVPKVVKAYSIRKRSRLSSNLWMLNPLQSHLVILNLLPTLIIFVVKQQKLDRSKE